MSLLLLALSVSLQAPDAGHFPLQTGNEWTYTLANGAEMKVRVTGTQKVKGVDCAVLETTFGTQTTRDSLALSAEGLLLYKTESGGAATEFATPVLRARLPFKEGDRWTVTIREGGAPGTYEYRTEGIEEIAVGGKTLPCRRITTTYATPQGPATIALWFAPGVGMIRQVYQVGRQSMSAELASWTVKPAAAAVPVAPAPKPDPAPAAAPKGDFVRYESKDGKALLFYPKGWKVQEAGDSFGPGTFALAIEDGNDRAGVLFMSFAVTEALGDSVALANQMLGNLKKAYPDFEVGQMSSSKDRARTNAAATYSDGAKKMSARFYFFHTARAGTLYALMARQDQWEALRPTLASIVANLAYAPEGVGKVLQQGREQAAVPTPKPGPAGKDKPLHPIAMLKDAGERAAKGEGKEVALQKVVAQDNSFSMEVPKGWAFQGAGLQAVATADARALYGYSSTSYTVFIPGKVVAQTPEMMISPYLQPTRALAFIMQRTKLSNDVRIVSAASMLDLDPDYANKAWKPALAAGAQVDNRLVLVDFTSVNTGTACRGLFSVTSTAWPLGTAWTLSVDGSWAPVEEYDKWMPIYARMAGTSQQNGQWVQQKNADQAAESARLNKNLMNSINDLGKSYERYNQSWWDSQKSRDYTSWAWSQTTLGQGSWVSEREGAAVVRSDSWGLENTQTGQKTTAWNHTNFTGQNPWTGEQLNEVNTRAEYEKHVRGR